MTDVPADEWDELDDDARDTLIACADLVPRTGAANFEIGYLHDGVPVADAGWYAHAQYRGARITVEDGRSPIEVADRLARRLLSGATCNRCRRRVTLGREHPQQCRWWRDGDRWHQGCSHDERNP